MEFDEQPLMRGGSLSGIQQRPVKPKTVGSSPILPAKFHVDNILLSLLLLCEVNTVCENSIY